MAKIREFDVVVIGAGVAGLTAAGRLAEAHRRVALIEARERVGGRIHTVPAACGGLPIELGAEFIHGLPTELIQLVDQAGLTRVEMEGDYLCFHRDFHRARGVGRIEPCHDMGKVFELLEQLSQWKSKAAADLSFSEFIAKCGVPAETAARATNYVEGFNAAEADRISIRSLARQQAAEDAISGDRVFRIAEGYACIPEYLLKRFTSAGGEFFPVTPVRSVLWKEASVEVAAQAGDPVFHAKAAVITVPLGVLQARSIGFRPSPEKILQAADQLAMGSAARVVYEFDHAFWSKLAGLKNLGFLFATDVIPPTWWTTMPQESGLLTGWVGGRKAKGVGSPSLPEMGLATLAEVFSRAMLESRDQESRDRELQEELRSYLVGWSMHDWQVDPYSLGAYTYVPCGAIQASDELSVPVAGTLFFAGEHTDTTGHWGTVHGAMRSGYRAAEQLLTF